MSKDKDQKASVPKVTHIKIGDSKKKKTKSFIDFAAEYTKKNKILESNPDEELELESKKAQSQKVKENDKELELESPAFEIPKKAGVKTDYQVKPKEGQKNAESTKEDSSSSKPKTQESPDSKSAPKKEEASFFPRFLRKQEESADSSEEADTDKVVSLDKRAQEQVSEKGVKLLTTSDEKAKGTLKTEPTANLNSFSSIFNRDSANIAGVKRVFKKSMTMMALSFVCFAFLSFLSLHLFSINLLWIFLLQILFVTITNIFYVVVADRSYVWIGLGLQVLVFLTAHSFVGEGFTIPTAVSLLIIILLIYLGYTEVEKTQLSSRLFSINHIASDSVRMLSLAVSIVLALGMFNSIVSLGDQVTSSNEEFLREEIFENEFIVDQIIVGDLFPLPLNWILLEGNSNFQNADEVVVAANLPEEDPDSNLNFLTFLVQNYNLRDGDPIISDIERRDLRLDSSIDAEAEEEKIIREKAEEFRQEAYGNLPYNLDTVLTGEKYKRVTEETYVYLVTKFDEGENDTLPFLGDLDIPLLPRELILPGSLAMLVFVISLLLNYIIRFFINMVTGITWFLLRKFDFARIDVENVEAEVVTI